MGYGRRAMNLLVQYYEGNIPSLAEEGKEDGQISTLTGDEVTNLQHIKLIKTSRMYLKKISAPKCLNESARRYLTLIRRRLWRIIILV